jgi:hypothetical protein
MSLSENRISLFRDMRSAPKYHCGTKSSAKAEFCRKDIGNFAARARLSSRVRTGPQSAFELFSWEVSAGGCHE